LLHRFVEEAQVTGQLQHPGTVPVHDIGRLEDGRPFIAMKLVRGRTLAALLAERASPADGLARFVGIFGQVCQTLAYAHSMGVLHRDLKPSNVMVGAFGEVQVMDWGLAKVLRPGDGGRAAEDAQTVFAAVRTLRSDTEAAQSRAGQALGTPAYMAPEQARGEVDRLDERCDVFGLGAILCEILTGQPPFTTTSAHEAVGQAQAADLTDAFRLLDGCGADAELVRLARACLAPAAADRLRDAGAVAAAVTAYQDSVAQRLRQAELERAEAQVKAREERKRRRLRLGLAAAVLLLVAGGAGGAWWLQQRRQAADAAVGRELAEARLLHAQARRNPLTEAAKFTDALKAARQARELADTGGASGEVLRQAEALVAELEEEAKAAGRDRRLVIALADARGSFGEPETVLDDRGRAILLIKPNADEQFAAAFREWGLDVDTTPTAAAASRLKKRPPAVRTEVIAALDQWAAERRRQRKPKAEWLAALAAALDDDSDPRRGELRALLARDRLTAERHLAGLSRALLPCSALTELVPGKDHTRLRRLAEGTNVKTEPVLGVLTLARALHEVGDETRAQRLLRAAVLARPQEVVLHTMLGSLLKNREPPAWQEAVECYAAARALRPELGIALVEALVKSGRLDEGLALAERLAAEQPSNPWVHFMRGLALSTKGRYLDAEGAFREAVRFGPKLSAAHNGLGVALARQGRLKEAEAAFRKASLLPPPSFEPYSNLGVVLSRLGRYRDAEAAFRVVTRLRPDDPRAHDNVGFALARQGHYQKAEAAHRAALRLRPDNATAHHNLGFALAGQERFPEAEKAFREAIRLRPDGPESHNGLGVALLRQDRDREADAVFRKAIALKPDYAEAYMNLGKALVRQGKFGQVEATSRKAIALKPNLAGAYCNLGIALSARGKRHEAQAAFQKAIALKPDYVDAYYNLGNALMAQQREGEAEAAYRKALDLKPGDPEVRNNLGAALYRQGRFREAEAVCREALRLKPNFANAHCTLGQALQGQGRFAEALASLKRGHELGSQDPRWPHPSARWVEQAERFATLAPRLPAVLQGKEKLASATESLQFIRLCLVMRRYAAAARLYAEAFAADPGWAGDLGEARRYNAACFAVLAASGQGADADTLDDQERARWRKQALAWLRAELAGWAKVPNRALAQKVLKLWQQDNRLATVRDPGARAKLPQAEREQWQRLWAEVETMLAADPLE
jgi:serine/threonine-protein kinase